MPAVKGSVENVSPFTIVNALALVVACIAFTMTQKFAPAVLNKALPK